MKNIEKGSRVQLYWDEQKMKESQKGRGQCEKIQQPKTPYCLSPSNSQEKLEIDDKNSEERQIQENLRKAKENSVLNSHNHFSASYLNEQLLQKMGRNRQQQLLEATPKIQNSFVTKRSEHYKNEYKIIQEMGKRNNIQ